MKCKHCGGFIFKDQYGDQACLQCGRPVQTLEPLDIPGSDRVFKGGRKPSLKGMPL